jgi:hypothetical protein
MNTSKLRSEINLSTSPSYDNALDEWKEARSVIARFDNNLHDLRKYGFTFVTALLAANGLLSQGGTSVVPDGVKAGILLATMGLIVTLKLLDTHYRHYQQAASIRGRILEDRLNLDITNDISLLYRLGNWWMYVQLLYYGFVTLTFVLGLAIFWSDTLFITIVLVAALVSGVLIFFINIEKPTALEDWSVDKKIVSEGTPVRITYTNLDQGDRDNPGVFKLSWNVKHGPIVRATAPVSEVPPVEVPLLCFESYDWLWETEKVKSGLYELEMFSDRVQMAGTPPRAQRLLRPVETGKPTRPMTIQVIKAKQEGPVKVMLEKTGNP